MNGYRDYGGDRNMFLYDCNLASPFQWSYRVFIRKIDSKTGRSTGGHNITTKTFNYQFTHKGWFEDDFPVYCDPAVGSPNGTPEKHDP